MKRLAFSIKPIDETWEKLAKNLHVGARARALRVLALWTRVLRMLTLLCAQELGRCVDTGKTIEHAGAQARFLRFTNRKRIYVFIHRFLQSETAHRDAS